MRFLFLFSFCLRFALSRIASSDLLGCGRATTEADDVAVWVLDIEVLRSPWRSHKRLEDCRTVGDALLVEGFDAIDARRRVEVLVVVPVLARPFVFGCFLQVKFQPIQMSDCVETIPRLAKREADLLIVRNRALKIVDEELWREGCQTRRRYSRSHRIFFLSSGTAE